MHRKGIRGVRPTRIELLKLRKREVLAQKGHDLLEEKRDAMVIELFRLLNDFRNRRRALDIAMSDAYTKLELAQMAVGNRKLREISCGVPPKGEIVIDVRHIMGVGMPVVRAAGPPPSSRLRGYGYAFTSAAVDEAADRFERVYGEALSLAEMEGSLVRLAQEIERTKRRVNALESIVIPQLQATQKHIETHLEELEREDIFRRKRTKMLLQKT
ncbi:MAG: V-type ATP synthase subunit D [Methanomicrobiaceae archaeon]|nr:V-type ATP synthase subunit D [Methanomicrobiaceae archaeon]